MVAALDAAYRTAGFEVQVLGAEGRKGHLLVTLYDLMIARGFASMGLSLNPPRKFGVPFLRARTRRS